jgi:hypothetical protein
MVSIQYEWLSVSSYQYLGMYTRGMVQTKYWYAHERYGSNKILACTWKVWFKQNMYGYVNNRYGSNKICMGMYIRGRKVARKKRVLKAKYEKSNWFHFPKVKIGKYVILNNVLFCVGDSGTKQGFYVDGIYTSYLGTFLRA